MQTEKFQITESSGTFRYAEFLRNLKDRKYKKIVVLTGAGISVSAGIPDFRSEKTGIYSQLQKYNLPYPEAIFELSYYKRNPVPIYEIFKSHLENDYKPTINHEFISLLNQNGMLKMNFTQNVDSLELLANLPPSKLLQAHGHVRTCHCAGCKKEFPIEKLKQHILKQDPMKCDKCQVYVKPDIVLFGEGLSASFYFNLIHLKMADLFIVMGTSLNVYPFANLVNYRSKGVPLVMINLDLKFDLAEPYIFLQGRCEDIVETLIQECELKTIKKPEQNCSIF